MFQFITMETSLKERKGKKKMWMREKETEVEILYGTTHHTIAMSKPGLGLLFYSYWASTLPKVANITSFLTKTTLKLATPACRTWVK